MTVVREMQSNKFYSYGRTHKNKMSGSPENADETLCWNCKTNMASSVTDIKSDTQVAGTQNRALRMITEGGGIQNRALRMMTGGAGIQQGFEDDDKRSRNTTGL